jgi:hypothetical protein
LLLVLLSLVGSRAFTRRYTIVCINVSESLIARSRDRPDFQNPLQKTGCVRSIFS